MLVITANPTPPIREAPHPFNKASADVVLRSTDLIDFRVRSHILLEASPVFESILSSRSPDQTPIPVDSDGKVLEALLLICYPISIPDSARSLDEVSDVLRVAIKYEMDLPTTVLEKELMAIARHSPLQVWALGCRMGLENITRYAALATLQDSTVDLAVLGDMEGITAADYYRLREFRRLVGQVESDFSLLTPQILPACAAIPSAIQDIVPENCTPDLVCSSSDGVLFCVRGSTVKAASSVIKEKDMRARRKTKGTKEAKKGKRYVCLSPGQALCLPLFWSASSPRLRLLQRQVAPLPHHLTWRFTLMYHLCMVRKFPPLHLTPKCLIL